MGANSKIEWTHHTFSPWWGCAEVSPACDHCYARAWAKRVGFADLWGVNAKRRFFSDAHWRNPLKWDRRAAAAGERHRVFCASMADVFDNHPDVATERLRLWDLIRITPHLDWLLLTKRIGNAKSMLPPDWGDGYANVWLGATVANQEEADRDIVKLLALPARVRFLSCEPLLGPVDLEYPETVWPGGPPMCCDGRECGCQGRPVDPPLLWGVHWVIAGSESGHNARAADLTWYRQLRDQCARWRVAFFLKQLADRGRKIPTPELDGRQWVEYPA